MNPTNDTLSWLSLAASVLLLAVYELAAFLRGARHPERVARTIHARMRVNWAHALARQPGFEIVAVQTLRNSLMSATITASTAALALMGTISVTAPRLGPGLQSGQLWDLMVPRTVVELILMLVLFASFVCSAMAMRFLNHAGFIMSLPAGSAEREPLVPVAATYVERAGILYSWGLRCFLGLAPLVGGILSPLAMPPITVALLWVLWLFDRPAELR